jgi:3-deoxy-7-phosphoheptulonate synthase
MLVVMKHSARPEQVDDVVRVIQEMGYEARPIPGKQRVAVGLIGNDGKVDSGRLVALPGVLEVIPVTEPYKQVSREWREEPTIIELPNGTAIGDRGVVLMAGPCSVESEEQILGVARSVKDAGATVLRGGAFKPRTSPYAFQGLGQRGLELLAQARDETGLAIITEALDPQGLELVAEYADIVQIGARNMQNYSLLRAAGSAGKPVMLKRGMSATIRELLLAAEYIVNEGAACAVSTRAPATCSISLRSSRFTSCRICRSSSIPATGRASVPRCRRWRGRRSPPERTA